MCERAENENLMKFWFRQYLQDPFKVLSFGALVAIFWMYSDAQNKQTEYLSDTREQFTAQMQDMRDQNKQQIQDMRDQNSILLERIEAETKAMTSVANRLEHIERELEIYRKNTTP